MNNAHEENRATEKIYIAHRQINMQETKRDKDVGGEARRGEAGVDKSDTSF